ncbi:MAG: S41 family peptidase [Paludibacteraceae bacterium]
MKKTYFYILFTLSIGMLTACRDQISEIENPNTRYAFNRHDGSYEEKFTGLWQGINQSYMFWDIDTVNWDNRLDKVLTTARRLDKKETVTDAELAQALRIMASGLSDFHLTLGVWNNSTDKYVTYCPANDKIQSRTNYHPYMEVDMHWELLKSMRTNGLITAQSLSRTNYTGMNVSMITTVLEGGIPYLYFNKFYITPIYNYYETSPIRTFLDNINRLKAQNALMGIIIDCRDNGGGMYNDLSYIVAPFIEEERVSVRTRSKSGLGHYDYTPWKDWYILPATSLGDHYMGDLGNIPIVYLQNMWSVSMAEVTANAISALPNGVTIGERSFGATGSINSGNYEETWSGPINYMNSTPQDGSYYAYTCTYRTLLPDPDGEFRSLECQGHTPDILCSLDVYGAVYQNTDNQLLRAIEYIYTGH